MYKPWPAHFILSRGLVNFQVSASPSTFNLTVPQQGAFTTGATTVSQVIGPPNDTPFTYSWSIVSGSGITINSPSSASTTFSGTAGFYGYAPITATAQCQVTNSFNQVAVCLVNITINAGPPPVGASINIAGGGIGGLPAGRGGSTTATGTASGGVPPYSNPRWGGSACSVSPATGYNTTVSVGGQPSGTTVHCWLSFFVNDSLGQLGEAEIDFFVKWT